MIEALPLRYPRWQRVRLVVVRPSGTPEPQSINEVVTSLFHGLQALGCTVDIRENEPIDDGTNIYFRAHLLPLPRVSEMPPGSIVYNFEQIFDQSPWAGPVYRDLLSRVTVWDYSRRNLAAIAEFADPRRLHFVPVGYMPQLTRIPAGAGRGYRRSVLWRRQRAPSRSWWRSARPGFASMWRPGSAAPCAMS